MSQNSAQHLFHQANHSLKVLSVESDSKISHRSSKDSRRKVRYIKERRKKFTLQEDLIITEHVQEYGKKGWNMLKTRLPGSIFIYCRSRLKNYQRKIYRISRSKPKSRSIFDQGKVPTLAAQRKIVLEMGESCLDDGWTMPPRPQKQVPIPGKVENGSFLEDVSMIQSSLKDYQRSRGRLQYSAQILDQLYTSNQFQKVFREQQEGYPTYERNPQPGLKQQPQQFKQETTSTFQKFSFQQQESQGLYELENGSNLWKQWMQKSPVSGLAGFKTARSLRFDFESKCNLKFTKEKRKQCKVLIERIDVQTISQENELNVCFDMNMYEN